MEEKSFAPSFVGNDAVVRVLGHALAHPVAAYVLCGVPHLGKRILAEQFVRALLGVKHGEEWRAHPDVYVLEAEEGKKNISVEQVRDLRERMSMRPMCALRTVAYVPAADMLNESGTNALLKVVEEPPADAVFVLVAEDAGRLPATLKSRCVILPMHRWPGYAFAPPEGPVMGAGFASAMLSSSLGKRLKLIEDLAKLCESEESPQQAWRHAVQTIMTETGALLVSKPMAHVLGTGVMAAMRSIGTSVSPRIILEATAIRLDGDAVEESRRMLPKHVSRGMSELFL